ncbi:VIT1/CCC1 transporter family protein [Aspergillus undulatus]|uniref:VIT1/CCC1 transporter family protein n=1 Tax=Aspergillus undulatus TaxID=1810928 RepID=UPI003CCCEE59
MAFLFIKQKLFPERRSKSTQQPSYRKPLLSNDEDDDSDTITNSYGSMDHDVEGQRSRTYRTFRDTSPSSSNYDVESTGSGSSSSRSRIDPRIVSDAILGLSDGLTVPFALSAGLSALGNTKVVVLGGLAELAAGAISMGLGGYVGAKSEAESYQTTVRETTELIETSPHETQSIVYDIFAAHGVPEDAIAPINASLHASPDRLREFLITFHHKESEPDCNQAWTSAITLALGYFIGGFIPLVPYFFVNQVLVALYCSVAVMAVTLLVFGYIKTGVVRGWRGRENILAGVKGGIQMVLVGGVAAGAAIGLVRVINGGES